MIVIYGLIRIIKDTLISNYLGTFLFCAYLNEFFVFLNNGEWFLLSHCHLRKPT